MVDQTHTGFTGLQQAMKKAIVEKDSGKNIYKLFNFNIFLFLFYPSNPNLKAVKFPPWLREEKKRGALDAR